MSTPGAVPGAGLDQQFTEGIFVGYRGYEEFGITPQYAVRARAVVHELRLPNLKLRATAARTTPSRATARP